MIFHEIPGLSVIVRSIILVVVGLLSSCSIDDDGSFLDDQAGILSNQEKQYLTTYNEALLGDLDIHFKLIILADRAADINEKAADIFGDLGEQTSGAKGLLFLVDPWGEQVRVEVGYDLEPVFPDIFIGYIEEKQMVPFFEAGKVGTGVAAATELLVSRVQRSIADHEFDPVTETGDLSYFSGGGGARITVGIGSADPDKNGRQTDDFQAQDSPEHTLDEYMRVLGSHEKNPELGLFTPETRDFFSQWVVTDAQQDNELKSLKGVTPEKVIISGDYAVIRYSVKLRTRPPYFLKRGTDGWMLDFRTMSKVIQMNHKNYYRFKSFDHPYHFAFSDWQFDKNGFPVIIN